MLIVLRAINVRALITILPVGPEPDVPYVCSFICCRGSRATSPPPTDNRRTEPGPGPRLGARDASRGYALVLSSNHPVQPPSAAIICTHHAGFQTLKMIYKIYQEQMGSAHNTALHCNFITNFSRDLLYLVFGFVLPRTGLQRTCARGAAMVRDIY